MSSQQVKPLRVQLPEGERSIGPGERTFIIAEAGINHNGSVRRAKQLIDAAAAAGADAVKFQKRTLTALYQQQVLDNPNSAEQKYQYLIPLLKEFELPEAAFVELKQYAAERRIIFMVNGWDKPSIDWIERSLTMPLYKVGSPDMTNDELLEHIASFGKPMIVSTGMSQQAEVEHCVALLNRLSASFGLLHANNTYPAPFDEINLKYLEALARFGVPVGYSGHERGIAVSLAAVARGACLIERHLTVDKSLPGPDHQASLLPAEFGALVAGCRQIEQSLGDGVKRLTRIEQMNREILGKSIVAARFIPDGTAIARDMLTTRSPAKGLSPQRMRDVTGVVAQRDIFAGEPLTEDDLTADTILKTFDGSGIPWKWGPVVRLREDFSRYTRFGPRVFEFHLTDKDLDEAVPRGRWEQEVVVHAPEYMHRTYLNPAAIDPDERKAAVACLQRSLEITRALAESFTGTPKFVIHPGGITLEAASDTSRLLTLFADTLGQLKSDGVEILPENLPPRPWVFGGEWVGNIFLQAEEIKRFLNETGYRLCLDTSHAALACNAARTSLVEMVSQLSPYVRHLHVSDGAGIGDEGLQIGEGVIDWEHVLAPLSGYAYTMVPEIWQGHLHGGKGFLQAMEHLKPYLR